MDLEAHWFYGAPHDLDKGSNSTKKLGIWLVLLYYNGSWFLFSLVSPYKEGVVGYRQKESCCCTNLRISITNADQETHVIFLLRFLRE